MTFNDRNNVFLASKGLKLGVVYDVQMLGRSGMFKPMDSRLEKNRGHK